MTPRERMLTALHGQKPDCLPATVHQFQPYYLQKYMGGLSDIEAFRAVGLDAAITYCELLPRESPTWRVSSRVESASGYEITRTTIQTPSGTLTTAEGTNRITTWVLEPLLKRPEDIELLRYRPIPKLDQDGVRAKHRQLGDAGILRTFVWGKQGGCWQDACELFGVEALIYQTVDDPDWVHALFEILLAQKIEYVEQNFPGLPIDLIETGGGASSNTVISPAIHQAFCLPYDRRMHDTIHGLGFPVVYHTCGGMTKIPHLIVQNGCDAAETLSPAGVGGDIHTDADAKALYNALHPTLALIGGMDQFNVLERGTAEQVRREVEHLFALYGQQGGYILSASDHFFEAPAQNLQAMAEAAHALRY